MAYKLKRKKIPENYFKEHELMEIRKKYKGKLPPFRVITREADRRVFGVIEREHKKGAIVEYKGEMAIVTKVEKKGLWIIPYKKDELLEEEKAVFVSEKDIEAGKLYPLFTKIPITLTNTAIANL